MPLSINKILTIAALIGVGVIIYTKYRTNNIVKIKNNGKN